MNGANADHQALRHLRVGEALGDEREHLELPAGQALRSIDGGVLARRGDQFDRVSEGSPRAFVPGRSEARLSQLARISASTRS